MRKPRWLVILLSVVLVLLVVGAVAFYQISQSLQSLLEEAEVTDIDFETVPDGTYRGSFGGIPVYASVETHVVDGRVETIRLLEHRHGRGWSGEAVVERIVDSQSLSVDAVSGATISSLVIVKAVEKSLLHADNP